MLCEPKSITNLFPHLHRRMALIDVGVIIIIMVPILSFPLIYLTIRETVALRIHKSNVIVYNKFYTHLTYASAISFQNLGAEIVADSLSLSLSHYILL